MGCISSKEEIDDIYPNVFQVTNVDEHGNRVHPGQLEITDVDLILYQQGKPPIKWPLKTLRRYGFDAEHFSFESGRRCPTGPGIYAFRCRRAEQLFNLLQSRIQVRNTGEGIDLTESASSRDVGYLEPVSVRRIPPGSRFASQNGLARINPSTSAGGTLGAMSTHSSTSHSSSLDSTSFINTLPISRPLSQKLYANEEVIAAAFQEMGERNNNKGAEELLLLPPPPPPPLFSRNYTNTIILESLVPKDMNSDNKDFPPPVNSNHLYMNINPGTGNVMPFIPHVKPANVNSEPVGISQLYQNCLSEKGLGHKRSPPPPPPKKLNYIVLDLEPSNDITKTPNYSPPPVTPVQTSPGYAAIDFKKTEALSHSVNPHFDHDSEGSRRTRHNSNIDDLTTHTRHSTSGSD